MVMINDEIATYAGAGRTYLRFFGAWQEQELIAIKIQSKTKIDMLKVTEKKLHLIYRFQEIYPFDKKSLPRTGQICA